MALSISFTKAQLRAKCEKFGIEPNPNYKKDSKDSYGYALREHYLKEKYPDGNIPQGLKLMLHLENPMTATRMNDCKPDYQDMMWNSSRWYIEEKLDGNRNLPMFLKSGFYSYSRNLSDLDLLPINYTDNIFIESDLSKLKHEFILDSEIVCLNPNISTLVGSRGCVTETQLQAVTALLSMNSSESIAIQKRDNAPLKFFTFDCLYYDGEWLLDKPLIERRKYLKLALDELQSIGFKAEMPRSNMSNKKQFYKSIIDEGGEGGILKDIDAPYFPVSSRSHRSWVKAKRSMSESISSEGGGDTIDAFISGYDEADKDKQWAGYVGALHFSCYLVDDFGNKRLHHIATVSSFSMELRKELTEWDEEGNPKLKLDFYNKVVEIDGQSVSARAKRLKHAVIVKFRLDKTSDMCDISESFLNSMIL